MKDGHGKSDNFVVPAKAPNKGARGPELAPAVAAEALEERRLAKGNPQEQDRLRTLGRESMQNALSRVREAARQDKGLKFTALLHHIYNRDTLRDAYFGLDRKAAPGVDGVTWKDFKRNLEDRLLDLSDRLKRGAYRARPVRRVRIPKEDGKQRLIGVAALEDKIVQAAATRVLNAVYEVDFLGFSYGFRPGRSQHNALDALSVGIKRPVVP